MVDANRQADHAQDRDGPPPGGLQHTAVRFEPSDAKFRWIFGIILGAIVVAVVIHVAVWGFFESRRDREATVKRSDFPLAPASSEALPPQPRLEQLNRIERIEKGNVYLREEQKEWTLDSYGPAGEGYVHIPIDRAMDLLADKLPVRTARPPADQARRQNGLVDAGASNSGRMFAGPPHD
jgi:hypothetical protein